MHYYKIKWTCGYVGTDGYEIIEAEEPMTEKELNDYAEEIHQEHCGEGWWEESNKDEFDNQ
jgi:hypothetical protein